MAAAIAGAETAAKAIEAGGGRRAASTVESSHAGGEIRSMGSNPWSEHSSNTWATYNDQPRSNSWNPPAYSEQHPGNWGSGTNSLQPSDSPNGSNRQSFDLSSTDGNAVSSR